MELSKLSFLSLAVITPSRKIPSRKMIYPELTSFDKEGDLSKVGGLSEGGSKKGSKRSQK